MVFSYHIIEVLYMNAVFHFQNIKRNRGSFFYKIIVFGVFLLLCFIIIYNTQIIPALLPFAEAKTSTVITSRVQNIIGNGMKSVYSDLVELKYDSNGNVVSLETNIAKLALINSDIVQNVTDELSNNDRISIDVPLGTLSGGALFTGRGPNIRIPLAVSPKITCETENEFFESGINQTLHRIIAKVKVDTYILLPASPKTVSVETKYCVAETVIVGKVPDAYTKINRLEDDISESEIDDIYDFGDCMCICDMYVD